MSTGGLKSYFSPCFARAHPQRHICSFHCRKIEYVNTELPNFAICRSVFNGQKQWQNRSNLYALALVFVCQNLVKQKINFSCLYTSPIHSTQRCEQLLLLLLHFLCRVVVTIYMRYRCADTFILAANRCHARTSLFFFSLHCCRLAVVPWVHIVYLPLNK